MADLIERTINAVKPSLRGLIQVGAHHGQELTLYQDVANLLLLEPLPSAFTRLSQVAPRHATLMRLAAGDARTEVMLNVATNDGASSSVLAPAGHLRLYPHIAFPSTYPAIQITLDELLWSTAQQGLYNAIVIDVQGYELHVLRGAARTLLYDIDFVVAEVNSEALYDKCALLNDVDAYLAEFGFVRKEIEWDSSRAWGNASYEKPRGRVAPSDGFFLLTSLYDEANAERRREFLECLERNIAHPAIDSCHVFFDSSNKDNGSTKFHRLVEERGASVIPVVGRLTFARAFEFASTNCPGRHVVVANGDVYFDESLGKLREFIKPGHISCLSRWDRDQNGSLRLNENPLSHDAWAFHSPLPSIEADFALGIPGCDCKIAMQARQAGLSVDNPARSVRCIHVHNEPVRHWRWDEHLDGPHLAVPARDLPDIVHQSADGTIDLVADAAWLRGSDIRLERHDGKLNVGFWTNAADSCGWRFQVNRLGEYELTLTISSAAGAFGAEIRIACGVSSFDRIVELTPGWRNYKRRCVGTVQLPREGVYSLEIEATKSSGYAVMNIQAAHLTPIVHHRTRYDVAIMTVPRPVRYLHQTLASLMLASRTGDELSSVRIHVGCPDLSDVKDLVHHNRVEVHPIPDDEWQAIESWSVHRRLSYNLWRTLHIAAIHDRAVCFCEDDVVFQDGFDAALRETLDEIESREGSKHLVALYSAFDFGAELARRRGRYYCSYDATRHYGNCCIYVSRAAVGELAEYIRVHAVEENSAPADIVLGRYGQHLHETGEGGMFQTISSLVQHVGYVSGGTSGQYFCSPTFGRAWPAP